MRTKSIANDILLPETATLIAEGHSVTHIVRGNSMNPFLVDRRDKVILAPFQDENLKRGVLVLAQDNTERFILHRIIRRNGNQLILMGDGNLKLKEQSHIEKVAGMVTTVIRKGKSYSCSGFIWRAYSVLWMLLQPLRRALLAVWRRI